MREDACGMSHNELKAVVDRSSAEDRLFLSAYLQHLAGRNNPAVQNELTDGHREIARGKKVGLKQLKQLDRSLTRAGL